MASYRKHPPYEYLTSRWGGMKIREELGTRIEKWLAAFDESEKDLLLELLSKFYYYTEERIEDNVLLLHKRFVGEYPSDVKQAVYTKMHKEQGTSFSNILFTTYWLKNNLKDYAEENLAGLLAEKIVPPVVVIVDDYSGTGKTLIKTIDGFLQITNDVSGSKFFFLVLHITDYAKSQIDAYAKETGVDITVLSLDESKNTFEKNYLYSEIEAIRQKERYIAVCHRFSINNDFVLGFEEISSLVAFHYNTPNNTLGLFWQDLSGFCALFPRHKTDKTVPLWKMQSDAILRRKQRSIVTTYGIDDGRKAAFMVYCISKEKNFSLSDAAEEFGLTVEQLDNELKTIIEMGYVYYSEGRFYPTAKLKSHLFSSRLKKRRKAAADAGEISKKQTFDSHDGYIPVNFK